jgi:glycosyltransferase involved in cell wall biosynthesis
MKDMTRNAERLILSPVPLTGKVRGQYPGDSSTFLDLASLRRGGIGDTLRTLRSYRPASVIVTGEETDLAVFRDLLLTVAMVIPTKERWYSPHVQTPVRVRRISLPRLLARILYGVSAGFFALGAEMLRLERLDAGWQVRREAGGDPGRCLYLKPALNFGPLVGGSVGHVAGVANALRRAGTELRIVAVAVQPLVDPAIRQVLVAPHSQAAYPHELNLFRYHRKYLREVFRQAADFRPAFVYQRYSLDDMSGIFLRRRTGIPLILEFNGSETWIQRHWGKPLRFQGTAERIERANLLYADLVVVVSDEIRKQVRSLGVPAERVLFYPNCVDSAIFDPGRFTREEVGRIRNRLGVPADADLLTFVGTFGQWHGTEVLAEAIRRLADHERRWLQSKRVHFLLVGDGQYGEKVRAILRGIPFVTLTGYRPQSETPAILAATDVCLSPHVPNPDGTPFFGSPTKLFEYMAMGKLVVASDLGQIGWVLRGWQPGCTPPSLSDRTSPAALLVEPGNPDSLIQGIRNAVETAPDARSRMGERARDFVLRSFTWDRNVRAVLDRFQQIRRAEEGVG